MSDGNAEKSRTVKESKDDQQHEAIQQRVREKVGRGCCQSPEPGAIWEREPRQEHPKENWGRGMSICLVLMEDTRRPQSLDI